MTIEKIISFPSNSIRIFCLFLLFVSFPFNVTEAQELKEGSNFVQKAEEAFQTGHFSEAIHHWHKRLQQLDQSAPSAFKVNILIHLAAAYQAKGLHGNTLEQVNKALAITDLHQDFGMQAEVLGKLSDLMLAVGATEQSLTYAEEGLRYAIQKGDGLTLAQSYSALGNVLSVLERYPEAEENFQNSIRLSQEVGQTSQLAVATINRTRTIMAYAEDSKVIQTLLSTAQTIQGLPDINEKGNYLASIGFLIWKSHQSLPESTKERATLLLMCHQLFSEAFTRALDMGHTSLAALALGYLGNMYEFEKRYLEALTLTQQAIFYAQQERSTSALLYRWQWHQGRILNAMERFDEAVRAYERSIETLKPIRSVLDIGFRSPPHSFQTAVRPVYYELADILLRQADKVDTEEVGQKLLKQARDTIELMKAAELEDYFKDDCVLEQRNRGSGLDQLEPGTLVLYPIVLRERLVLLVTLPSGKIKQITMPVTEKRLRESAQLLAVRLQTRPNNRFLYQAQELYSWIIRPLENDLKHYNVHTIVYIPDGPLRISPLSVLHDGHSFLLEKYAIATVPALNLTQPKAVPRIGSRVLLAGLSHGVQGYSPLPSVSKEMATIQAITGGEIIKNQEFTFDKFKRRLQETPFSIIHLATHAEFNGDPDNSFLLTYGNKLNMGRLENVIGFGRYREEQVELLTLSACQTALGDERASLGLAGVAVKAGARSVVATLWFVDDEATSLVLMDFYQQLFNNPDLTKAKALQNAQKKLIVQKRFWHPTYWAPFLLIGNWL